MDSKFVFVIIVTLAIGLIALDSKAYADTAIAKCNTVGDYQEYGTEPDILCKKCCLRNDYTQGNYRKMRIFHIFKCYCSGKKEVIDL